MKKKRYSDISFLPAFLVPSTVIKFLFYWRPVDRLERSTLTVSYKRNYHKKSANPFIFSFEPHTFFKTFFFNSTQCCTVAGLFFKEKSDSIYPLFLFFFLRSFINNFTVWDICCMFGFFFWVFF